MAELVAQNLPFLELGVDMLVPTSNCFVCQIELVNVGLWQLSTQDFHALADWSHEVRHVGFLIPAVGDATLLRQHERYNRVASNHNVGVLAGRETATGANYEGLVDVQANPVSESRMFVFEREEADAEVILPTTHRVVDVAVGAVNGERRNCERPIFESLFPLYL